MRLEDAELRATVHAGRRWSAERDIPDAVGWADLAHAADETVNVIRRRMDGRIGPGKAHCLPLPKGVGAGMRQLTVADPYDEIVFRALVGRAASAIDEALGQEVTSYRLVDGGPGWTVRNYRYANGLRTSELVERLAHGGFGGLGTLDVRNYYPSIATDQLVSVLRGAGVTPDVTAANGAYLDDWSRLWGVRGVPIGPEASGLLGNVICRPSMWLFERRMSRSAATPTTIGFGCPSPMHGRPHVMQPQRQSRRLGWN